MHQRRKHHIQYGEWRQHYKGVHYLTKHTLCFRHLWEISGSPARQDYLQESWQVRGTQNRSGVVYWCYQGQRTGVPGVDRGTSNIDRDREKTENFGQAIHVQLNLLRSLGFNPLRIQIDPQLALSALVDQFPGNWSRHHLDKVDAKIRRLKETIRSVSAGLPWKLPSSRLWNYWPMQQLERMRDVPRQTWRQ